MAESTPTLNDVFETLGRAADEHTGRGAVFYGAYAKKYLGDVYPGFDERQFGFKKFVDLLREGDSEGRFRLELVDGHPRLIGGAVAPASAVTSRTRLKPDLWATMLTWDPGVRQWDRLRGRAVFIPTDDDGTPRWETAPADFAPIVAVTMEEQLAWMREFAEHQPADKREEIIESLDGARPGEFKKVLSRLRLQSAWTTRLQQRVAEHAATWATTHHVPISEIMDVRSRDAQPAKRAAEASRNDSVRPADGAAEELRARLHRVIDQMSLTELAALPIPAGYLVAP